jgi:hypothetical protein
VLCDKDRGDPRTLTERRIMKAFLNGLKSPIEFDSLAPMNGDAEFHNQYEFATSVSLLAIHGEGGFNGEEVGIDDEFVMETGFEGEYMM